MSPRAKKPADPRHIAIKDLLEKFWQVESRNIERLAGTEMPWGAADAGALGQLLRSTPWLTVEMATICLRNRLKSRDHDPCEPIFVWIKHLLRYIDGPLNEYKRRERREGNAERNRADERNAEAFDATKAALARVRGMARN